MSSPQEKKRKTGGGIGEAQRKRGAEKDVDVPTLGQVAEEARFEPLRELLKPVKDTPVTELSRELRDGLLEDAANKDKPTLRVMQAFLGACDARVSEAAHKRSHVASEEHSPGKY